MRPTKPPAPEIAATYRARGYWLGRHVREYLPWAAREFPDRPAVVAGDRMMTFAEVDEAATRVALALHRRGVGRDDVVSFQLPNWPEAVVLYQGIMKLGAVANPIVPIYQGHELRHILNQAGTSVVVVPGTFRGVDYPALYRRIRPDVPGLREVVVVGDAELADETPWERFLSPGDSCGVGASPPPSEYLDPDDVALLLYTSGTTAAPKGALHSSNTLVFEARSVAEWFALNERDVIFNPSPVTHITGVVCALTAPFMLGCTVVLQDSWNADEAWHLVRAHRATFMIFATPFLNGLLGSPHAPDPADSPVRYVVCGGADMPPGLVERATAAIGPTVRMYGATECPSATCTSRLDPVQARAGTDGRWMKPTEGRVVDDTGRAVLPEMPGEILWRGPDMFLGYLDAALNDGAFTEDGFFRTGDLGVQDEHGYLRITGRLKDIINRAGEKFSAKEIEQLLYEHPAVREVAVVAVPDPVTVEKACAFVVAEQGAWLDLPEIERFLTAREVSRRKFPERLEMVAELPKTASGKIQKHLLRARVAAR